VGFEKCINYHIHELIPNINISYAASQMFLFFPTRKGPQQIKNMGLTDSPHGKTGDKVTCLTAAQTPDSSGRYSLSMQRCAKLLSDSDMSRQLFSASWKSAGLSEVISSTKHALPSASLLSLRWKDSQKNTEYCVVLKSAVRELKEGDHLQLVLQNCDSLSPPGAGAKKKKSGSLKTEFVLERTFTEGPTLSPLFSAGKISTGGTGREEETESESLVRQDAGEDEREEARGVATGSKSESESAEPVKKRGGKRRPRQQQEDRLGLVDQLKTDDGAAAGRQKKARAKGKGKGKAKAGGRKGSGTSSASSALLPQKRQGSRGQTAMLRMVS
jgi:hypothetical protein